MTLSTILVLCIILCGMWPLFFTTGYAETKLRMPHIVTLVRVLFILAVVLLLLVRVGAIQNKLI